MATAHHHHQSDNIFDHGIESQFPIIRPFIERIKDCSLENSTEEFRSYFLSQLSMCLSTVVEREKRPNWVKDVEDYQKKSEITIFLSFMSAIDFPDDPSSTEKESIHNIYESVKRLGQERDWDLQILHIQFMRLMGAIIHNQLIHEVMPKHLEPKDFN